jgi:uncharacterized protein (TIGR03437 family)
MMRTCLLCVVFAGLAAAQPVVDSVSNAASSIDLALPNGGLAQGGMFVAYGRNLGPESLAIVQAFPLQRTLGGTSVRVTAGGSTYDALMIYTLATQVAAILPSAVPAGPATLTVSFNSQTSVAFAIRVERSRFGIFALNQAGSGPGIFTDPANVVNTLLQPAAPGSVWIVWGTGIGPVTGDEAGGPLPGDLAGLDVAVLVGGRRAEILYRGRSGCCAGLDQIAFRLSADAAVSGCYVPVVVTVGGVPSNTVTMSIAETGSVCSDSAGFSRTDLSSAAARGNLNAGNVALTSVDLRLSSTPPASLRSDYVTAGFGRYAAGLGLIRAQSITGISVVGACTVFRFTGLTPMNFDPAPVDPLNAGTTLTITGPPGSRTVPSLAPGAYAAEVGATQGIPGLPGGGTQPIFFAPGNYTVTNGAGAAVGAFSGSIAIPARLTWSNQDAVTTVDRTRGLAVQWTGADAARDYVQISGTSIALNSRRGAGFVCRERASAGSFTVPPEVLSALPPSQTQEGVPSGQLAVSAASQPVRFTATGLDLGMLTYLVSNTKFVTYR